MGFSLTEEAASWDEMFRRETDRETRRRVLEKAQRDGLVSNEEAALRQQFMDHRYAYMKKQQIDYFIRGWTRMSILKEALIRHGNKAYVQKELDQVLSDWQADRAAANGEIGQRAWYDELYNMSRLYIELCEADRRYNSVILGFGRIKKETREEKLASEFRSMIREIPERFGREQDFALLAKAAEDAFTDYYPDGASLLA